MNTKPLVTIAIPFYNCDQFLDMAICSVINQSYSNWELLLINDGSTDKSLEIALKYKDPRIKLISDGSNKGLIYRLNQSIVLAHGYFYARMDADDIMHPKRIECQVEYMINNPQIDVLGTSYYSINSDNNIMYQIDIGGYLNKKIFVSCIPLLWQK